ncbi:MAG: hypothetical protein GTN71_15375, partial [Anaerolineae bacterium]|nr:hypothetical protein [Anaerolineae bacterium]
MTVGVSPPGNGTVDQDPADPYTHGDVVTLTVTADPGWTFFEWSGDLTGSQNPETLTMDSDKTVTATLTQEVYTLTVGVSPSGNGSVDKDPDQATYLYGEVVTLTVTADLGWTFSEWSGDLTGSDNPVTLTMDSDKTVTATLIQEVYTLTVGVSPSGSGSVDKEPDQETYLYGDVVTLTVTADPGWKFFEWSGDLTGNQNPVTLTMDSEKTVTATLQNLSDINIWYGSHQVFGHIGIPQDWVNILGNVSDPDGVVSLTYSLNGGPELPLSMGPDTRRLESEGDFNVDIAYAALNPGLNQVVITAIDELDNTAVETVTVEYVSGNVWPETYSIDWSSVADIPDVAQIVDGLWTLEADSIRPAILGYDREIAIGDVTWDDYEVTVPITIYDIDESGYDPPSSGPMVGILMRWTGHTDDPVSGWQPKSGYLPLGAIGMYHWKNDALGDRLQITGNEDTVVAEDTSGRKLEYGVPYVFKMHVETITGPLGLYSFKVWEEGQPEPSVWDLVAQEGLWDPQNGSLLLIAHHVDASFGDVTITPGPFADTIQPIISNIQVTVGETWATVTWDT